jgi:hypothetical protein
VSQKLEKRVDFRQVLPLLANTPFNGSLIKASATAMQLQDWMRNHADEIGLVLGYSDDSHTYFCVLWSCK